MVDVLRDPDAFLSTRDPLGELASLAKTAGALVVERIVQNRLTIDPGTYIGAGKSEEFARFCQAQEVDTVIFDDELTGAQARNLEKIFVDCKVLDRTALILEIFAQRARHRPNRLGSTICRLIAVQGAALEVAELDAIDGTPVLDIKPVMAEFLPRSPLRQPAWSHELMADYWSGTPEG